MQVIKKGCRYFSVLFLMGLPVFCFAPSAEGKIQTKNCNESNMTIRYVDRTESLAPANIKKLEDAACKVSLAAKQKENSQSAWLNGLGFIVMPSLDYAPLDSFAIARHTKSGEKIRNVVVSAQLVEKASIKQLEFAFGHEIGHLVFDHPDENLNEIGTIGFTTIGTVGLLKFGFKKSSAAVLAIGPLMYVHQRCVAKPSEEYSADEYGIALLKDSNFLLDDAKKLGAYFVDFINTENTKAYEKTRGNKSFLSMFECLWLPTLPHPTAISRVTKIQGIQ